jgi:hypothetical protein
MYKILTLVTKDREGVSASPHSSPIVDGHEEERKNQDDTQSDEQQHQEPRIPLNDTHVS